ncbi:MAG: hypothetical protein ABSH51_17850 [Solirubrobacteraceae bacterium]|jgi:signal transduction histidine kinase
MSPARGRPENAPQHDALATSELGPAAQEAVDLATAAEDALDATHTAIDQRQITVEAALEPAPTRGDRVLLERMIANLVENAVRHNNTGGGIEMSIAIPTSPS